MISGSLYRRVFLLLCCVVLRHETAFGLVPAPPAPSTVSELANAVRDSLQASLAQRQSRIAIEVPPGAPLTTDRRAKKMLSPADGDKALAAFVQGLFPASAGLSLATIRADALEGTKTKKKKKTAIKAAKGFGESAKKEAFCSALNLAARTDVCLVVGALSAAAAERIDEADKQLGQDTLLILLNSRRAGLAAGGSIKKKVPSAPSSFMTAFALSPPPPPVSSQEEDTWQNLVAYRIYPSPWAISQGGGGKKQDANPFLSIFGQASTIKPSKDILWTGGDSPPTSADTESALLILEDLEQDRTSSSASGFPSLFSGWQKAR